MSQHLPLLKFRDPPLCPRPPDLTLLLALVRALGAAKERWLDEGQGGVWGNSPSVCPARRLRDPVGGSGGRSEAGGLVCTSCFAQGALSCLCGLWGGLRWAGCQCQAPSCPPPRWAGCWRLLIWNRDLRLPWTETPRTYLPGQPPSMQLTILLNE